MVFLYLIAELCAKDFFICSKKNCNFKTSKIKTLLNVDFGQVYLCPQPVTHLLMNKSRSNYLDLISSPAPPLSSALSLQLKSNLSEIYYLLTLVNIGPLLHG